MNRRAFLLGTVALTASAFPVVRAASAGDGVAFYSMAHPFSETVYFGKDIITPEALALARRRVLDWPSVYSDGVSRWRALVSVPEPLC